MPQAASQSHDSPSHDSPSHDDDLIIVPKGRSKWQFYGTIGLLLFVLLIFTVGGSFQSSMGGIIGGEETNPIHLSWTDPTTQVRHEVRYDVFMRRFKDLGTLHSIGAFQPRHVPEGKRRPSVSQEDVGLIMVLDQMATDAGIAVTDAEFVQFLLSSFQTQENEQMFARQRHMTVPGLEDVLRNHLRVAKLMSFLSTGAAAGADSGDVEALWKEEHPQFAFQYAEVEGVEYLDQARAALPADEGLLEWFHAQPLFKQQEHFTEESFSGLVAYASLDEPFDATMLLEQFPAPEGLDPEVQARSYYNRFNNVRFKNEVPVEEAPVPDEGESAPVEEATEEAGEENFPAPAPQDEEEDAAAVEVTEDATQDSEFLDCNRNGIEDMVDIASGASADLNANGIPDECETDDESGADEPQQVPLYKPYEEVAAQCLLEAPLHAALTAWFADLRMRMSAAPEDAPLDFATEAEAAGLTLVRIDEPLTRAQLEEQEGWGGKFLSNQFTYALEGDLLSSIILEEGAIIAGQLTTKLPRQEPPIDQIREAVGEEWAQERAVNLAVETLESLRDGLGERPAAEGTDDDAADDTGLIDEPTPWLPIADEAAFKALLIAAGFEMVNRPWLEQFEVPDDDYDAMSAADKTIRVNPDWFELESGQVPAALANFEKTHAILVRYSGKRDRPIEEIKASDLLNLRQQVAIQNANLLGDSLFRFNSDWFKERFKVDFDPWNRAAADDGADAEPASDPGQ
ncbi:MAG TPA: hypothetical protein EYQ74_04405 [Planctomycetes bacterium]|nr:hypothetical protein [Planctomycetota bacterium]HIK61272.1 hypothetical protein [Planctomycetota bacterium]